MEVLDTRSDRLATDRLATDRVATDLLATDLLALALTTPGGPALRRRPLRRVLRTVRWPPHLDLALTFACLIDLAGEGRVRTDASGSLVVDDAAPTGSPAHDLLLRRIADGGSGTTPSDYVWTLRREVANGVLADAVARGQVSGGHHGPRRHRPVTSEPSRADRLQAEVRRVIRGEALDQRATALFILCMTTPVRGLLPASRSRGALQHIRRMAVVREVAYLGGAAQGGPRRRSLCRRLEQLPPAVVADAFGPGAARLGIATVGDVTASIPQVSFGVGTASTGG
jgi:hypothetical protein